MPKLGWRVADAVPDTPFAVKFSKTLPHTPSGVRSRKPLVGRGPRDQSSGQKPRARAPEVLACGAALGFERASRREAWSGWSAAFSAEFRPGPIFRGCSE